MSLQKPVLLGGPKEFAETIPVGQLYFPSWDEYVSAFKDIFQRQYYTNQGPLVCELEERLADYIGVKHAICVTNMTIGLIILAEAMALNGKVILPAFTFVASAQSLQWAGLEPLLCDVDIHTHQIDTAEAAALVSDDVSAIMGVNLWGGACDITALESIARQHNIPVYYDSAHAFGVRSGSDYIGLNGEAEVFSFHATKILNATEGGCICTNNSGLASRIRNIRSSYGAGKKISVAKTANGRMSEAQAAIALLSLSDLGAIINRNQGLYALYQERLSEIPGIALYSPANVDQTNYQYVVCTVNQREYGLNRDQLLNALWHENVYARRYFFPGLHKTRPFSDKAPESVNPLPNTERLCSEILQLPVGALVDNEKVDRICGLIASFRDHSQALGSVLSSTPSAATISR
jgi:dTDP-4-amino-4,6-dideoxygalactose transaminase